MSLIHPSAIIDKAAQLDSSVRVGPHCVIGANVRIGANTQLDAGVIVDGHTTLGADNHIHAHATIGGIPQDKKYRGEPCALEIGDRNTLRECVTVNIGTVQDGGLTRIGSDNWIMAYVHIAHDCHVGSHTIMANATQLAGHVRVGDWAILGGITAVHQFVQVGAHSMTGAGTVLLQDLPPYVMAQGYPATPHGINAEGLKRRGFSADDILWIKRSYKKLYREGLSFPAAQAAIAELQAQAGASSEKVAVMTQFLAQAQRGVIRA